MNHNTLQNNIYFFNNKKFQIIFGIILLIISFSLPVKGELNTSEYKFITISELNIIPLIPDYNYTVLINDSFLGYYGKDDNIFYPDNSNITIIIPSPILTSTDNIWELSVKPMMFNMIGFILTWGILIIIICYILYIIIRKIIKGY